MTCNQPVPPRPSSIENDAHGIEKLLLKTQVSEHFLHSEVNLIIQHIIVQDQVGQDNDNVRIYSKEMGVSTKNWVDSK